MVRDLRFWTATTESPWVVERQGFQIPQVDSSTVVLVTQNGVCQKVLPVFNATLPASWPPPLPTRVYVVKVGTVFVAMHPHPQAR